MKKRFVKSLKAYDDSYALNSDKILEALKRRKDSRKKPTSIALDETTIRELKAVAEKQGLPYQVLIRALILDGLSRLKSAG